MNDNGNGKDDTIRRILRKMSNQRTEYPESLWKARREQFIRWMFSRRFGCIIFWTIILGIILIWILNNL